MSQFMIETISDVRSGRQSWRVVMAFTIPSFVLALALALVRQPF